MSKTNSESRTVSLPPLGADDFKRIKGIGPHIEQRLHAADILTFAQLAGLSPDDIAQLLGNPQLWSVERIIREDWVGQARAFSPNPQGIESQVDWVVQQDKLHYATFTVRLLLDKDNSVRQTDVVSIQDGQPDKWAGWEVTRLVRFMVEHAALSLPGPLTQSPTAEAFSGSNKQTFPNTRNSREETMIPLLVETGEKNTEIALQLIIHHFSLNESSPEAWLPEQSLADYLHAQIEFQLLGKLADKLTEEGLPYIVQVLVHELLTNQTMVLATVRERLQAKKLVYKTFLEFTIPTVGRYQSIVKVLVPDVDQVSLCLGPIIHAVPG